MALVWYTPATPPLELAGLAWYAREGRYRRLPVEPAEPLPEAVDGLANNTAGVIVRFRTDSPTIRLKAELAGEHTFMHMPATGQCGFDCYLAETGVPRYHRTAHMPNAREIVIEGPLLENAPIALRQVVIHFPLYQGVRAVEIGLEAEARVLPPLPFSDPRPVVVYGTSITQGGCANRPGMAYTNILSRRLNREFINLGFSGSGHGEPEVARLIASIPNPAAFVLDFEANCGEVELFRERFPAFARVLREAHPDVPLLAVSQIPFASELVHGNDYRLQRKQIQLETLAAMRGAGEQNLFFVDGDTLLGESWEECTVDGVHPTDLGFMRMADIMEPVLRTMLAAVPSPA